MSPTEPLLDPKNSRYNLFPILYPKIYEAYETHRSLFWVPNEVVLYGDEYHWNHILNEDERAFIKLILAFFAVSDYIVNENLQIDQDSITVTEYQFYLRDKAAREDIHTIMYARLLEAFVPDEEERLKLFNSVTTIQVIADKVNWFRKYFTTTFQQRQVATAITEGIFFSGSFCAIFWLKKRHVMPGLTSSNEFIAKEEGFHCKTACMIYNDYIVNKLTDEEVEQMIRESVEVEVQFIRFALEKPLKGINAECMIQYIKYNADEMVSIPLLGKKLFNVELPFEWMSLQSQDTKTNFFEGRPTNYAKHVSDEQIRFVKNF